MNQFVSTKSIVIFGAFLFCSFSQAQVNFCFGSQRSELKDNLTDTSDQKYHGISGVAKTKNADLLLIPDNLWKPGKVPYVYRVTKTSTEKIPLTDTKGEPIPRDYESIAVPPKDISVDGKKVGFVACTEGWTTNGVEEPSSVLLFEENGRLIRNLDLSASIQLHYLAKRSSNTNLGFESCTFTPQGELAIGVEVNLEGEVGEKPKINQDGNLSSSIFIGKIDDVGRFIPTSNCDLNLGKPKLPPSMQGEWRNGKFRIPPQSFGGKGEKYYDEMGLSEIASVGKNHFLGIVRQFIDVKDLQNGEVHLGGFAWKVVHFDRSCKIESESPWVSGHNMEGINLVKTHSDRGSKTLYFDLWEDNNECAAWDVSSGPRAKAQGGQCDTIVRSMAITNGKSCPSQMSTFPMNQ